MPDLLVDTRELRAAAAELRGVVSAAEVLGGRSGRAMAAVPAFGAAAPAQAVDSFVSSWVYGVGWIRVQAHELSSLMLVAANNFEAVEAALSRGLSDDSPVAVPPVVLPPPAEEPVRASSGASWGLLGSVAAPMQVQLSGARHVRDLVAGDPDQVSDLARLLTSFADALGETRSPLSMVALGGWMGLTASLMEDQLNLLVSRLVQAELAFAGAGLAVGAFGRALVDAQSQASTALSMWREAEYASQVWRGVIPGVSPAPGAVDDPGAAGMARAPLMLEGARQAVEAAGRTLAAALAEAEIGSPNDPGTLAKLARHANSFGSGLVQWGVGAAEGVRSLAGLAVDVFPLRYFYDREGYDATSERLAGALKYAGSNPGEIVKAALDLDTLKSDPAKWAGQIAPDLLLLLATAGMAYAARSASAASRIERVEEAISRAGGRSAAIPQQNHADIDRRLREMGLIADTPARSAAEWQLKFGLEPDDWAVVEMQEGQWLALDTNTGLGSVIDGPIKLNAREWAESLETPPIRSQLPGDSAPAARVADSVALFEVRGGPLELAQAIAHANPQFGPGGGVKVFVPDIDDVLDNNRLSDLPDHHFEGTTRARHEDHLYRQLDPDLPIRPLDPVREGWVGGVERGQQELGRTIGSAAAAGLYERLERPTTESTQTSSSGAAHSQVEVNDGR